MSLNLMVKYGEWKFMNADVFTADRTEQPSVAGEDSLHQVDIHGHPYACLCCSGLDIAV